MTCTHWDGTRHCGASPARQYLTGRCCPAHTPARLAGRQDHHPDPALALESLRAEGGQVYAFRSADTALNDDRAIASGRRRSNAADYRSAKTAEAARKAAT